MLVLSRKPGEKVIIGNGITITILETKGNRVRLAIDAPDDVRILRAELRTFEQGPLPASNLKPVLAGEAGH